MAAKESLLLMPVEAPILPHQVSTILVPDEANGVARQLFSQLNSASNNQGPPRVAAVPLLSTKASKSLFNRLFHVGCAARVLHISYLSSRGGTYMMTLEGLYRIRYHAMQTTENPSPSTDTAAASDPPPSTYAVWAENAEPVEEEEGRASSGSGASTSTDPAVRTLALQLRRVASAVLGVTEGPSSRSSGDSLSGFIHDASPGVLADLVGGLLLTRGSQQARLALLAAVDVTTRLQLVLSMASSAVRSLSSLAKRQQQLEREGNADKRLKNLGNLLRDRDRSPGMSQPTLGGGGASSSSSEPPADPLTTLQAKVLSCGMPADAQRQCLAELARLKRLGEGNPSAASVQTWLETMVDLPWALGAGPVTRDLASVPLADVKRVLDEDHAGLESVKKRFLEFTAVLKLIARSVEAQDKKDKDTTAVPAAEAAPSLPAPASVTPRGPVICLVGPPGVGKTSLGHSIARALGRPFQRVALGGVRDEAEIRGHRRTYVGAMAGRIITALKKAGSRECVMLLDEIDKLGRDTLRGDPSSALLEVLDPAQNSTFTDAYLGVPFPLDRVIFICTANSTSTIPGPLLDRMEVVRLPGYTLEEKVRIAGSHLLPRVAAEHAMSDRVRVELSNEVLGKIIEGYTREAGVRSLERHLAAIFRHVAVRVVEAAGASADADADAVRVEVSPVMVEDVLGAPVFHPTDAASEMDRIPGVTAGLVWSPSGGSLQFVESVSVGMNEKGGRGNLTLTGQLGEVLNESAQLALSWLRANGPFVWDLLLSTVDPRTALAMSTEANRDAFLRNVSSADVHIHFPAGAIPKDGPSAGVTLTTSLVSLFARLPVRSDFAMTGEISLRGHVLPVGGVKEKVLAAHRGGIATVIVPERNLRDVGGDELPGTVRQELKVVGVKEIAQVLRLAFKDVRANLGKEDSAAAVHGPAPTFTSRL